MENVRNACEIKLLNLLPPQPMAALHCRRRDVTDDTLSLRINGASGLLSLRGGGFSETHLFAGFSLIWTYTTSSHQALLSDAIALPRNALRNMIPGVCRSPGQQHPPAGVTVDNEERFPRCPSPLKYQVLLPWGEAAAAAAGWCILESSVRSSRGRGRGGGARLDRDLRRR